MSDYTSPSPSIQGAGCPGGEAETTDLPSRSAACSDGLPAAQMDDRDTSRAGVRYIAYLCVFASWVAVIMV